MKTKQTERPAQEPAPQEIAPVMAAPMTMTMEGRGKLDYVFVVQLGNGNVVWIKFPRAKVECHIRWLREPSQEDIDELDNRLPWLNDMLEPGNLNDMLEP